jgi:CBS domain-containing protein
MNVEQLMTRNVKFCTAEETLEAAARRMLEHDIGCLPVRSGDGRVIGMLTDRDICMAACTERKTLWQIPVVSAMSLEVISCKEDQTIVQAEDLMRSHHVRRLPVRGVNGGVVGILSLSDIAREAGGRARTARTPGQPAGGDRHLGRDHPAPDPQERRARPGLKEVKVKIAGRVCDSLA